MVKFSIIATYYQPTCSDDILERFLDSLDDQTCQDFEVLLLHDGPLEHKIDYILDYYRQVWGNRFIFVPFETHRGNWGHPMRSNGINLAHGEYYLHTNVDNIYYPKALSLLEKQLDPKIPIYIMPVVMRGIKCENGVLSYDTPRDYNKIYILTGNPPVYGNIDMMQLIAHNTVWKKLGWYDTQEQSDGLIYKEMCTQLPYKVLRDLIGEHY